MRRLLLPLGAAACLLAGAGLSTVRLVQPEVGLAVRLVALAPWAVPAYLLALLLLVSMLLTSRARRRYLAPRLAPWAALAVAGLVLHGTWLAPLFVGAGEPPADAGPRLRVMTANLLNGTADAEALVRLAEAQDVDLLAVQEVTPTSPAADGGGGSQRAAAVPRRTGAVRGGGHDALLALPASAVSGRCHPVDLVRGGCPGGGDEVPSPGHPSGVPDGERGAVARGPPGAARDRRRPTAGPADGRPQRHAGPPRAARAAGRRSARRRGSGGIGLAADLALGGRGRARAPVAAAGGDDRPRPGRRGWTATRTRTLEVPGTDHGPWSRRSSRPERGGRGAWALPAPHTARAGRPPGAP